MEQLVGAVMDFLSEFFDKAEWSCFEAILLAFGAIAASHGHWWPAGLLWAVAVLNIFFRGRKGAA